MVRNMNLAVEIETFYGRGDIVTHLEHNKLVPYRGKGYKVWVVIPNLQAMLFAKELLELQRRAREDLDVEVLSLNFDPDVHEGLLIPLRNIFRLLKEKLSIARI